MLASTAPSLFTVHKAMLIAPLTLPRKQVNYSFFHEPGMVNVLFFITRCIDKRTEPLNGGPAGLK